MKPSSQVCTSSSDVDSKFTATAIGPTMRSVFRVDIYTDEHQQNGSLQVPKPLGCSWACYCSELVFSVSSSTSGYKYSYNKFRGYQSKYLGVFQILIGILCIGANTAGIVMGADSSQIQQGIWSGMLMAVAGSFGVGAGKQKSKCMIVGMALFSMVAFLAAACAIAPSVIGIDTAVRHKDMKEYQFVYCRKFLANYGSSNYGYEFERYKECRRFMDDYREDTLYSEKLATNVALVVLASVAIPLLLWSFVISVMPFSCCCGRDQESSDSESEQEYNTCIIGTDQLIVTSQSGESPQYTDDTMFSMPNTTNAHPYQPTNEPIDSSGLAVIEIGGKSAEKRPLTDHV